MVKLCSTPVIIGLKFGTWHIILHFAVLLFALVYYYRNKRVKRVLSAGDVKV